MNPNSSPSGSTVSPDQQTNNSQVPMAPPAAMPDKAANASLPSAPESWPGAFGAFKYSKQAVMINIWTLVLLFLTVIVVALLLDKQGTVGQFISGLISTYVSVAYTLTFIAGVRKQELSYLESLKKGLTYFVKFILLSILVALVLAGSLLLVIIPFFFVLPRTVLTNYYLLDQNMGVIESFKASWEATKGHSLQVWGIIGASILMALPMITIIGIPVALYLLIMYSAIFAVLYEYLKKSSPSPATTASAN